MILIIGATGMVGGEVCRQLIAVEKPVRAMLRKSSDPSKRNNLSEMGIEIVEGDLRDPSTFGPALNGVDTVITTVSAMPFSYVPGDNDIQHVDLEGMKNFIDHSKAANVQHFVYTSFSKQIDLDFPLRNAKRNVENHLVNSGMTYTILRPSCFMEVWLSPAVGFDVQNAKVNLCGSGTEPVSYISFKDVAKFAVESLENPSAENAKFELGGPEELSQLDAVKIFEEFGGKKFEVQHVPVEALKAQRETADDPMAKSFSGLMESVAHGDPIDMKETMKVFPVELISVKDFAKSMMN